MHRSPGPIRQNPSGRGGNGRENKGATAGILRRKRNPLRGLDLQHAANGRRHGQRPTPEAPQRDTSSQSIPPLDFFTPLASMWFLPRFPRFSLDHPGVSSACRLGSRLAGTCLYDLCLLLLLCVWLHFPERWRELSWVPHCVFQHRHAGRVPQGHEVHVWAIGCPAAAAVRPWR